MSSDTDPSRLLARDRGISDEAEALPVGVYR